MQIAAPLSLRSRFAPAVLPAGLACGWLGTALLAGGFFTATAAPLALATLSVLLFLAAVGRLRLPSVGVIALAALAGWTATAGVLAHSSARPLILPILYASALWLAEHADGTELLRMLRLAILALSLVALAARLLSLAPTAGQTSSRLQWPITYSNGLGLVAAAGVLLWLTRLDRPSLAAAAVCATAMILTFSRSAIFGCALALLVKAVVSRRRLPSAGLATAAIVCVAVGVFLAPGMLRSFAASSPDSRDVHRLAMLSGHGRTALWRAAWEQGTEHPVIGVGPGGFSAPSGERNAHSLELQTYAETGVVGVLVLLAFLAYGIWVTRLDATAAAAVALWITVSAVDWDWQLPAATLPAIFAIASCRPTRPLR